MKTRRTLLLLTLVASAGLAAYGLARNGRRDLIAREISRSLEAARTVPFSADAVVTENRTGKEYRYRVRIQNDGKNPLHCEIAEWLSGDTEKACQGEKGKGQGQGRMRRQSKPAGGRGPGCGRALRIEHPVSDPDILMENYDYHPLEDETVAGRPCRRGRLVPRRHGRPSCTLWRDAETGLILAFESPDRAVRFESIDFTPPETPLPEENRGAGGKGGGCGEEKVSIGEAGERLSFRPLDPGWLPGGFRLQRSVFFNRCGQTGLHLVYTDGLATISLLETSAADEKPQGKKNYYQAFRERRGATNFLSTTIGEVRLAVAGPIPEEELLALLSSMQVP